MRNSTSIEIADGIAWITIDDGKVNALSTELIGEVSSALDAALDAEAVAVLTGREGIFSAGFDMTTFSRGRDAGLEMLRAGAEIIIQLLAHPLPVVSVCTGHAYPMGAFLLLASDVRFAIPGDWRIGMNETAIGLTVPNFALELARHRLTPPGFASISSGAMFGPDEAQRLGYVDRIVAKDRLGDAVKDEAIRLQGLDMPSFAATKARVHDRARASIRTAMESELQSIAAA
jgi:enoyl-CoA hydratase